ncbi:protein ACCELERATED CELL DEATH 6-like [Rhodamnia argentea]|uniref:Protein ACCELERATED CELL DEATH 6-like n=1 Tax=Rhodamnia argentea TaxID=178133 RepID=A0ABM3HAR3_9MYRT|nr:protein ACCELERATED CELL DEATH 6-like [Rhodamnia argentea]
MDSDSASIDIGDREIWDQRRARLKALESVNGTHLQAEFKHRAYLLLRDAVEEGNVDEFIKALEKYSAEERVPLCDIIDVHGPSGNSWLHVAAGTEKADILRVLLEVFPKKRLASAKVNYRGDTALHVAARAGRIHTAELLLGCGSIVDMANDTGNTALHEAVKNRHYDLTCLLLHGGSSLVYKKNKESKCPLYLAVETGELKILRRLMMAAKEYELPPSQMEGMSPVHGAVMHRRLDMLEAISELKKELFDLRDARGGTPLHLAAYVNYVEGVKFLVKEFTWSTYAGDEEGHLPIHVACKMGHLEAIKELLRHWLHPEELLTLKEGQNILHVAAKYGRHLVVNYILYKLASFFYHRPSYAKFEKLINAKDKEGNTPLHVATLHRQEEALVSLTLDYRVDLELVNNDNLTALDIVDERITKADAPRRVYVTQNILESAGAPRSKDKAICRPKSLDTMRDMEPHEKNIFKDIANTRMLVATLVVTVTFAAGFQVPGGYNSSKPDVGIAALLGKPMYDVFVICNAVALYSSIIAVAILHGSENDDRQFMASVLRIARIPVVIALAAMSVAFVAGVYVTTSKRTWVANVALIVGITPLFVLLVIYTVFHRGVLHKLFDMLKVISELKKELFDLRDARGGAPLHLAAYVNYVEGVKFLVKEFTWSYDTDAGIAKLLGKAMFDVFVICNAVALYSSIIAVAILHGPENNDWQFMDRVLGITPLFVLLVIYTVFYRGVLHKLFGIATVRSWSKWAAQWVKWAEKEDKKQRLP